MEKIKSGSEMVTLACVPALISSVYRDGDGVGFRTRAGRSGLPWDQE